MNVAGILEEVNCSCLSRARCLDMLGVIPAQTGVMAAVLCANNHLEAPPRPRSFFFSYALSSYVHFLLIPLPVGFKGLNCPCLRLIGIENQKSLEL